jgi:hypothetical protein
VVLYAARFERWREAARPALSELSGEVIASAGEPGGLSVLLALPGTVAPETLQCALHAAGAGLASLDEVGSHAERFRVK